MARIKTRLMCPNIITVVTAGTRVPLSATSLLVSNLTVQWEDSNAGVVYLGGADVDGDHCLKLNAATPVAAISVDDTEADEDQVVLDLSEVYVDAGNSGDKVRIAYVTVSEKLY